ncbi:hypothetical protein QYM36_018966 [Artemia franciscana]|uniref:Uncharacterized protein n=1 Tax=Artemia franciscana TaxID=6661 RepID=A0AA88H378_ARTSF|nr:hypothetical protein QYM36_018966 [Artemia franciscana]
MPLEKINNPDDDVLNPERRKNRNSSFENYSLSVPVLGEYISARLCDDPSANAFSSVHLSVPVMGECISARLCDDPSERASNFVRPTKMHYEEISIPDDDDAIQKRRKTPNNFKPSVPVIDPAKDECASTRLCDKPSANASNFVHQEPLEEINSRDDDAANPERRRTRNLSFENSSHKFQTWVNVFPPDYVMIQVQRLLILYSQEKGVMKK